MFSFIERVVVVHRDAKHYTLRSNNYNFCLNIGILCILCVTLHQELSIFSLNSLQIYPLLHLEFRIITLSDHQKLASLCAVSIALSFKICICALVVLLYVEIHGPVVDILGNSTFTKMYRSWLEFPQKLQSSVHLLSSTCYFLANFQVVDTLIRKGPVFQL